MQKLDDKFQRRFIVAVNDNLDKVGFGVNFLGVSFEHATVPSVIVIDCHLRH
jgi:hypothetical protein